MRRNGMIEWHGAGVRSAGETGAPAGRGATETGAGPNAGDRR